MTVGAIQGGTTYNIIPDSCLIKGTVRTLHPEARDIAEAAIKRLAAGMLEGCVSRAMSTIGAACRRCATTTACWNRQSPPCANSSVT